MNEMAAIMEIPEVTYLNNERNGTVELNLLTLVRFSAKSGIPIDYIMGLTDDISPYPANPALEISFRADTSRVRELRQERDITGKAMAEQLEISPSTYSIKELHPETLMFTIVDLIRIAILFDTSLDYLLKVTNQLLPHPRGTHRKVLIGVGVRRAIKYRLGMVSSPVSASETVKEYCKNNFNIRQIRLARKLLQREVAIGIGVNLQTYTTWEQQPHRIPSYYLIKLADFYNTTVDYLVGRLDDPNKE